MINGIPDFQDPDLAAIAESLPDAALHALPFGVIRLDGSFNITFFSETEARNSGHAARRTLGRNMFTQIAPCFASAGFLARIESALAAGAVDIEFSHVADFPDGPREIHSRILSGSGGGIWMFNEWL